LEIVVKLQSKVLSKARVKSMSKCEDLGGQLTAFFFFQFCKF
jgi:hypothetical protein